MTQTYRPISEVIMYGSVAYRFYVNNFRGEVEYFAKVGKPIKDKQTEEIDILPWIFDKTNRDFLAATETVANKLEELKNAAFRQKQNTNAASVSPLDQQVLIAEESVQPVPIEESVQASGGIEGGLKVVKANDKAA